MKTKGIILAAGRGTRLMPASLPISKSLLPIFDKPMTYFPLETLIRIGIQDILFIVQEDELSIFEKTFGSGDHVGLNFSYKIQEVQRGIADAYIIAEDFLDNDSSVLALCDNIFLGDEYFKYASLALEKMKNIGGCVFGLTVSNPEKFGVIDLDEKNNIIGVEEKPSKPKSNLIIPGMYFFDSEVVYHAKELKTSARGELEITDLIQIYINKQKLHLEKLNNLISWYDTGNARDLLNAAQKVQKYEIENKIKIGAYEIAAFEKGFIDVSALEKISKNFINSDYGQFIKNYIKILNS